ncbi:MAG: prepilin peptidase [Henriciella sp.]|nr:prepilin peptidase [Henriciella sp.]
MIASLFALSFFAMCLFAALRDIETLTIPNWLNAWLAFLFLPACILAMPGWGVFFDHVLIAAIALIVSFFLFGFGVFGGGDAKMIPAVMIWIGPAGGMDFMFAMAVVGGLLALIVLIARRLVPVPTTPVFGSAVLEEAHGIPYGVAIAAGAFMAAPASPFLTKFLNEIIVFG